MPLPGASLDGGRAAAFSSPLHPSPGPVPCEGPEQHFAAGSLIPLLSSFQQLVLVLDVGETAMITFLGEG